MADDIFGGLNPWNNYYEQPFHSQDVFRYNTGGASAATRGAASQLMTGNEGTRMANLERQGNERAGGDMYRNLLSQITAGGGGGNYNAMAGIGGRVTSSINDANTRAYAEGGKLNQAGMVAGGQLSANADKLDQEGRNDSLNYLAKLEPKQLDPRWGQIAQQNQQNENWMSGLGKGLLGGVLGSLTGGLAGYGIDALFGMKNPNGFNPDTDSRTRFPMGPDLYSGYE